MCISPFFIYICFMPIRLAACLFIANVFSFAFTIIPDGSLFIIVKLDRNKS